MSENQSDGISWSARPPAGPQHVWEVIGVDPGPPLRAVILSTALVGVYVHRPPDGLTYPCVAGEVVCEGCRRGHEKKWQGWLAVARQGVREQRLVCLTDRCVRSCPYLLDGPPDVRGYGLTVWRSGQTRQSAMLATCGPDHGIPYRFPLPPCPDLHSLLRRLWAGRFRVSPVPLAEGEIPQ